MVGEVMIGLEEYRRNLTYCLQCGLCLGECPVFRSSRLASLTSRGRMRILYALVEGELTVTGRLSEILDQCLMCEACSSLCPSGMPVAQIMAVARHLIKTREGLPFTKKITLWALSDLERAGKLAQLADPFCSLATDRVSDGLIPKGLFKKFMPLHQLPKFGEQSFLERYGGIHRPGQKPVKRVGYFVGCMTNLCYQSTGKAVLQHLLDGGYEVVIPRDQQCCGLPAFTYGDLEEARKKARENLQIFRAAKVDMVVADCASCANMWKENVGMVLAKDKPEEILPVMEVMGFLARENSLPKKLSQTGGLKVAYHAPCHTRREEISRQALRQVLYYNEGAQYIAMETETKCCGGGGSFGLLHPELLKGIQREKIEEIQEKKPDILITTCPSCRMYLTSGVRGAGLSTQICHPLELV